MSKMEELELLKAAIAVALADGDLRRPEKGVIEGLAARVGIGQVSFDAMVEAIGQDDSIADNFFITSKDRAQKAMLLLVAEARIDGEISDEERNVLVRIAMSLRIASEEFREIYEAGIARADSVRKSRREST